jgi:D-alanyl-D-alanine dipeptidase
MPLFIGFCLGAAGSLAVSAQVASTEPDAFMQSTQMILVTSSDWNAVGGRLQRYQRDISRDMWRPVGVPISVVVGKNGMGWGLGIIATNDAKVRKTSDPVKKEGDGKSPAGVFALGAAFGYASQPLRGSKMPYLNLTPSIECVDDSGSKYYNQVIDRSAVTPDWDSSEHMRSVGEAYRWGIVIDHNGAVTIPNTNPPVARGGSCVFLHIWGGPKLGTAGCTAMSENDLEVMLAWLDPKRKPLLVQMPAAEYERLAHHWGLPPSTIEAPR